MKDESSAVLSAVNGLLRVNRNHSRGDGMQPLQCSAYDGTHKESVSL